MHDDLYLHESGLEPFQFGPQVAQVFDDMVVRSVPHYDTIQDLLVRFALSCCGGHPIYDLGCSTGSTLLKLAQQSETPLTLVGIDNSPAMLELCQAKMAGHSLFLENHDLESMQDFPRGRAGAVILCLVLQFLRPPRRKALVRMAYENLEPGGCLLMVEKIAPKQPLLNSLFIEFHHDLKRRNGYSDIEIARKRDALENRLIPFSPEQNLEMLREAGFEEPAVFFACLNFQGYVAIKAGS